MLLKDQTDSLAYTLSPTTIPAPDSIVTSRNHQPFLCPHRHGVHDLCQASYTQHLTVIHTMYLRGLVTVTVNGAARICPSQHEMRSSAKHPYIGRLGGSRT